MGKLRLGMDAGLAQDLGVSQKQSRGWNLEILSPQQPFLLLPTPSKEEQSPCLKGTCVAPIIAAPPKMAMPPKSKSLLHQACGLEVWNDHGCTDPSGQHTGGGRKAHLKPDKAHTSGRY